VIHALEVQSPFWEPGTAHGYHAITYGYLVGEVVRRISGKSLGTFWQEEIAQPLGLEFWIGLPPEQEHRVAPLVAMGGGEGSDNASLTALLGPDSLIARALSLNGAFADLGDGFNSPALHAAEMPAANGITNARSLARFYAALIGGVENGPSEPLLTREQIDQARTCQTEGADRVLSFPGIDLPTTIGLGFWTSSEFAPYGGARAFGHSGAGGSVGFADPESGIAGGYVMNRMMQGLAGDPRSRGLIKASYEAVGAPVAFV
jgi:CubicO group peptidase (beta-lactamase class C family)